jgi:hypothetical protein
MNRLAFALVVSAILAGAGCSTHVHRLHDIRNAYYSGDSNAAQSKVDAAIKSNPGEADVLKLDQGTILLCEGKPQEAEKLFREVRDRFDLNDQKDAGELIKSMLTDDQAIAYPGEDHEKVLVRVFLALTNLMGKGDDAGAYALQVADKQQQIIQKGTAPDGKNPKATYPQVGVGAYIFGLLRESTHKDYDDAARSYEKVCQWVPGFGPGKEDLQRAKTGHHSQQGHGVVYVFSLVGRGPYKEERAEIVTQAALLIVDRILSIVGKRSLTPTLAPVKVPVVVCPPNQVGGVLVTADGQPRGRTETITDVGQMAKQQADLNLPYVIARAVARRAVKKAALFGLKEATHMQKDSVTNLLVDVGGVVWEATESADTRCWGLLPDKVQVLRVELPAGKHQLALTPTTATGQPIGHTHGVSVDVADGRNTYILASFPTAQLAGRVQVNQP